MSDIDRRRGKWVARWRDGGKQRSRAFDRKLDAERFLTAVKADQMKGLYVDHRAGVITVKEYAEQRWLPAQLHLRVNSASTYASHVASHIVPLLGNRQIGSVKRTDCTAFVAKISSNLAPSTVATVYAVFRSMMQSATEDGLIAANPASRVRLPRVDKHVVIPMPASAVEALAASITPRYELSVWLGAGAGLREGEALGLIVPRLDFLRRRVHVVSSSKTASLFR